MLLSGCAPNTSLSDSLARGTVHGDADTVVVTGQDSVMEAYPFAMGHCAHFHRSAAFDKREGQALRFSCVAS